MGWKQGLEGGVLLDLGSHALDLLTWIAGYPQEAMCAFRRSIPPVPRARAAWRRVCPKITR